MTYCSAKNVDVTPDLARLPSSKRGGRFTRGIGAPRPRTAGGSAQVPFAADHLRGTAPVERRLSECRARALTARALCPSESTYRSVLGTRRRVRRLDPSPPRGTLPPCHPRTPSAYAAPGNVTLLLVSLLFVYLAEAPGALGSIDAAAFHSRLLQPHWAAPAVGFRSVVDTALHADGICAVARTVNTDAPRRSSCS